MLLGWISKQVFLPSHSNFLHIESKLLGNFSYTGFPRSLAPLSPCLSQLKEKCRLTISKAAKSLGPKLYSKPTWLVPALSTAKAGSCLGQQAAGGSKTATVPLPTFLCRSGGDGAACCCQACGPRCVSQWLCLGAQHLPGSSNCCLSPSHGLPWGRQLSQLQFCPLLAIPRRWAPILVVTPRGGKIELYLHQQRALNWLCRRVNHVKSALFLQMRLRFFSYSYSLEKVTTERVFLPLDFL